MDRVYDGHNMDDILNAIVRRRKQMIKAIGWFIIAVITAILYVPLAIVLWVVDR